MTISLAEGTFLLISNYSFKFGRGSDILSSITICKKFDVKTSSGGLEYNVSKLNL